METVKFTLRFESPRRIEDEVRDFGAGEVIVVVHARERETRQERGERERRRHELDVPVTHVVIGEETDSPGAP